MKYKLLISIGIAIILSGFPSCSFLNLEPEDGVTREKFWKTKEEVYNAVMGCYAAMMNTDAMQRFFLWGELRAEMISLTSRASSDLVNIHNGDITPSYSLCSWASIYTVINNCNTVLEYAKQTQQIDESFSQDLLSQYEGEAVCIRALMYFYLVRTFGDVPYIKTASLSDTQDYEIAKTPQAEIIADLIADLKSYDRSENGTSTGIPYSYSTSAENKGRFTVWGLKALLADIYLWNEEYENCLNETSQILNSGQFALVPVSNTQQQIQDLSGNVTTVYYPSEGDADNFFYNMYAHGNSIESIFELQFAEDYENPFYTLFNPTTGTVTINSEVISSTDLFLASGIDKGWYDIRGEGVSYKSSYVWKWIGLSRSSYTYRARGESFSNWIFYRLADVYLMKAEALTQLGKTNGNTEQLEEALALVHTIRSRACAPESTDMISEGEDINANTLESFVLTERAREFTHEGKRWFDVLRNAKRNNYAGINYLTTLATYAAKPEKAAGLQSKWKSNYYSHYLPIYEDELKTNSKLVQNPFYTK